MGWVANQITESGADHVIAHSMGTVIVLEAMALCPRRPVLTLLGSPLHHRYMGPVIDRAFKSRVAGLDVVSFWHRDDHITKHGRKTYVPSVEISVAHNYNPHDAPAYLEHPAVRAALARNNT